MKKLLALLLLLSFPAYGLGGTSGSGTGTSQTAPSGTDLPTGPTTNGLPIRQNNGNYSYGLTLPWNLAGFNVLYTGAASGVPSTDWSASSRILQYTNNVPISRMKLIMFGGAGQSSAPFEAAAKGPLIQRASIQYPSAQTPYQFSVNGSTTWVADANSAFFETDPLGVNIPANTAYYIVYYNRVPFPPTSGAASSVAGGGCQAISTTFFYEITSIDTNLESGATAEFSAASGVNNVIQLSWTPNTNAQGYNIYRSTTTGAEVLVARVFGGNLTGYRDSGCSDMASAQTPPAAYSYWFQNQTFSSNYQTNTRQSGGNGLDYTTTISGTWLSTPANNQIAIQYVPLTDDFTSNSVCVLGDSISAGIGIVSNAANGNSPVNQNWGAVGIGTTRPFLDESIPGAKQLDLVNGVITDVASRRVGMASLYCNIIVDSMGRNDAYLGTLTWQNMATNQILLGQAFKGQGRKYYVTTITPGTSSTDSWTTASNQTAANVTNEGVRKNYNVWVRNGMKMSSGTPVASGGTPTPYIDGYFDMAAPIEVNSSNVVTANGGFWLAPAAPTYTGQVLTGSPSATSLPVSTASYPVNGLTTYVIKMTSGTQNGNFGMVSANTATGLTLFANGGGNFTGIGSYVGLTGSPSAGDTFNIYAVSTPQDGVHGTKTSYALVGAAFSTWLAALPAF